MDDIIENDIFELFIKYNMPLSNYEITMSLFGNFIKFNCNWSYLTLLLNKRNSHNKGEIEDRLSSLVKSENLYMLNGDPPYYFPRNLKVFSQLNGVKNLFIFLLFWRIEKMN